MSVPKPATALWLPFAALILGAAFWGGTWPAARAVHGEVPPIALAFLRWFVAALVLAPFCLPGLWRHRETIGRELPRLLFMAACGVAGFTALIFVGLQYTTAINGALINAATPVYVILLSLIGLGERSRWKDAGGAAVAFIGLAVIITRGEPQRLIGLDLNPGDLWISVAMFLWALYNIFLRRWTTDLPPFIFLFSTVLLGVLLLFPAAAIEWWLGGRIQFSTTMVIGVGYLGTGASIGAYICWNYGVRRVGAAPSSLFQYLIPVFAAIFAIILLSERLYLYHLAGAALIIGGILVANTRAGMLRRRKKVEEAE